MKNLTKVLLLLLISLAFTISSCNKDEKDEISIKTYELSFEADHWVEQENQFCDPYAYYSWSVGDHYDVSDYVIRNTVYGKTTTKTGDWIFIYISVNDVFDHGSVSCESSDGTIFLYASTDNLYINESDSKTAPRMRRPEMRDTIINDRDYKYSTFKIN